MDIALLAAVLGTGFTILVAVVGAALWMERRFNNLERRLGGLATAAKSQNHQLSGLFGLFSGVLAALNRAHSLPDEDYRTTSNKITELLASVTKPYVDTITATTNPLSTQEGQRLRELIYKAQRGEFFTQSEAEEYNRLIKRVQEDRPDDPGLWPLIALGAFLIGLYPVSKKKEQSS